MPGIVAFPSVVEDAVEEFGWLFANTPARWHLAEYLTGLMVADRKNVSAINAEFADTTDQSCLNRWMTQVPGDAEQLNEHRLAWLQGHPSTRYSARGVIAIDHTLVDHHGERIEDVGWFWDHADQRYLIAHDYVIANYVCTSGKHYPLEFRRFRKRGAVAEGEAAAPFRSHTQLFQELVDWVVAHRIPGAFAFDSYFTSASSLNHLQGHDRGYVGDLKSHRKVAFQGRQMKAGDVAAEIPPEDRKRIVRGDRKQWYFTKTVRLPGVDHPVRLAILWDRKNGRKPVKFLVTNRIHWEITRLLNVYRQRWTGHGDLPPGRQATFGAGGLSGAHRRGPDPAPLPGDAGAQFAHGPDAAGPCECVGSYGADDHRRSLSSRIARDAQQDPHVGGPGFRTWPSSDGGPGCLIPRPSGP